MASNRPLPTFHRMDIDMVLATDMVRTAPFLMASRPMLHTALTQRSIRSSINCLNNGFHFHEWKPLRKVRIDAQAESFGTSEFIGFESFQADLLSLVRWAKV
eukprot:1990184-Amphidinium_carterae.1